MPSPRSERDRMARVARDLAALEQDVDATGAARANAVAAADADRIRDGRPPLATGTERPEEEFYRRARALGLGRRGR